MNVSIIVIHVGTDVLRYRRLKQVCITIIDVVCVYMQYKYVYYCDTCYIDRRTTIQTPQAGMYHNNRHNYTNNLH
jgi:hypothetical protein